MKHIDKAIQEHYSEKHLSDSALDRIIALGEHAKHSSALQSTSQTKPVQKFNLALRWWTQTTNWQVASMVFFTAIVFGIFIGKNNSFTTNIDTLVLEEIAMNHNKRLDVEFPITQYEPLRLAMAKLNFSLTQPKALSFVYQLVGGRYCSIQGRIAAQLKIKNINNGKIATLYITPVTDRIAEITDQETTSKNVNIKLWSANNFLYGLATDTSNANPS